MSCNLRWTIVFLLFLIFMVNYLDRVALSIAMPMIGKELLMNAEEFGIIFGSFFFGYALFNFFGGLTVDKYGPTLVMALAVGFWSVFCGLTSIATGFWSVLVLRVLFGMAEGPICAAANKMINSWFPKKQTATVMGIISAGSPLGGAVAGPMVGYLAIEFGWRLAFVIIGVIGLVWILFWKRFSTDIPPPSEEVIRNIHHQECGLITPGKKTLDSDDMGGVMNNDDTVHYSLRYYLCQPIILVTAFSFFCYNYILFFFLSWFPGYLVQTYHLKIEEMSRITMIPWIIGFVGLVLGGWISDRIFLLTGQLLLSRKIVLVVSLLAASMCIALAGSVQIMIPSVLLMSAALFFLYITGPLYWVIIQEVVHRNYVGSISGFIHFIGSLSGMIGPVVTGLIVQYTTKFDSAFFLAGSIAAIGAFLSTWVIKSPQYNK